MFSHSCFLKPQEHVQSGFDDQVYGGSGMIWARMLAYITGTVDQELLVPAKNSVQIEIVAFTEPQPVTFPGHADSTFVSARLFPGSCLSASRDSCSPTSASGLATFEPRS